MMFRMREWLRQFEEVLVEIFKVVRFAMAIAVVVIVEVLGMVKLWGILVRH